MRVEFWRLPLVFSVGPRMKNNLGIKIFAGLVLAAISLIVMFPGGSDHDPKDLSYWVRAGASRDWSTEAARGKPRAQFQLGLTMIQSNLVTGIDRVPGLSAVPLFGKRFFEKVSYEFDTNITQQQLAEAYRWIKRSADHGFPPAIEAEKLLFGKIETFGQGINKRRSSGASE